MQLGRAEPQRAAAPVAPLQPPDTHTRVPNITCPSLCQGSWQVPTIRAKSKLPSETGIGASGSMLSGFLS